MKNALTKSEGLVTMVSMTGRGGTRPGAGRPRLNRNLKRRSIDLEREDDEELVEIAREMKTSIASVIREAIRTYIGGHKVDKKRRRR